MVGSAISTGSQNMATMLVGRGIAGIGAAGMMAVSTPLATLPEMYMNHAHPGCSNHHLGFEFPR